MRNCGAHTDFLPLPASLFHAFIKKLPFALLYSPMWNGLWLISFSVDFGKISLGMVRIHFAD